MGLAEREWEVLGLSLHPLSGLALALSSRSASLILFKGIAHRTNDANFSPSFRDHAGSFNLRMSSKLKR
jgi:hypothetical protein